MGQKGQECHIMNNQEKNTYVRNMLLKTLAEMLEEKKLEGIPVRTLCERAGAARAFRSAAITQVFLISCIRNAAG